MWEKLFSNLLQWLDYAAGVDCFYWAWTVQFLSVCTCNLEQHTEQSEAYVVSILGVTETFNCIEL